MTTDTCIRKIIETAFCLVESGWTQGDFRRVRDGRMCYCAVGAIYEASKRWQPNKYNDTLRAVERCVPSTYKSCTANRVIDFNDDPQTTKEDVLNLFKKALTE